MLKNEKIETLREELNQLIINRANYDEILKKSQELDELLNDEKNDPYIKTDIRIFLIWCE